MSRPTIVRADTIDLQDQENPTASTHHKLSPDLNHSGLAPHQAAEIHHVLEERHSEEQSLADAWNLTPEATNDTANKQAQGNGEARDGGNSTAEGGEHNGEEDAGESENEGDDDMMDRISSSPSIDDGGYISKPQHRVDTAQWPARSTSLTVSPTPLQADFNSPASPPSTHGSSPFPHAPDDMLWRESSSARYEGLLLRQAMKDDYTATSDDSSTCTPLDPRNCPSPLSFTKHHHWLGRSDKGPDLDTATDEIGTYPYRNMETSAANNMNRSTDLTRLGRSEKVNHSTSDPGPSISSSRSHSPGGGLSNLSSVEMDLPEKSPSMQSLEVAAVLLSLDGPILDQPPPSPSETDSSWEDTSESDLDLDDSIAEKTSNDDANLFLDLDNRFIDSGWGGECLQDTEDIDFEFVYALHTFVATVEGQANATKGDTMVLLDDSNSYWWLVRVVKDGSIGYLPAEHIETPTERLARLNKHRNIDVGNNQMDLPWPFALTASQLSATMLSDNSEMSRNPIKKAMRRRNAKTVQFAAPTYVEASDYDYSSEEEDQPGLDPYASTEQAADGLRTADADKDQQQNGEVGQGDDSEDGKPGNRGSFDREQAASGATAVDEPQLSPRLVDKTEAAPLKSRKGTPRNTDSFLKDDSIETRKITLTPGILREDASSTKSASSESARNNSLESLEKVVSPPEPASKKDIKEQKKKEPKKGGMLSGLFKSKKKDKKVKDDGSEGSSEKMSLDLSRESSRASPITSGATSPVDRNSSPLVGGADAKQRPPVTLQPAPTRNKLQKSQAADVPAAQVQGSETEKNSFVAELPGSEVAVEMAANSEPLGTLQPPAGAEKDAKDGPLSPLTNMLRTGSAKDPKPTKAKRSKQRVELDDFDSPAGDDGLNPFQGQEEREGNKDSDSADTASESPIEIISDSHGTFMHGTEIVHIPTPGADSGHDEGDNDKDEPESLSSSPSLAGNAVEPASDDEKRDGREAKSATPTGQRALHTPTTQQAASRLRANSNAAPTAETPSARRSTPAAVVWSDSSLRAWLEDGSEVKDMLLMIHDRSSVVPVSDDHPMMKGLYDQPRKGVQDLMGQLDGLLGSFIQKRGISLP
nr:tip elongation aberrant protein tea4 [Quercus suber]